MLILLDKDSKIDNMNFDGEAVSRAQKYSTLKTKNNGTLKSLSDLQ